MANYSHLINDLKLARQSRDSLEEQLHNKREELLAVDAELAAALREDSSIPHTSIVGQQAQLISEINSLETQYSAAFLNVENGHTALLNLGNPAAMAQYLDDQYPVLLMPIRIETRFMGNELWVRFFPDDLQVVTHEPDLTPSEIEAGVEYWTNIWGDAYYDSDIQEGAWRWLARAFGSGRAAYIANMLKPTNPVPAQGNPNPPAPIFPSVPEKQDTWTRPAHVKVMPDRFVVRAFNGSSYVEEVGNRIPEPLIVGPDPRNLENGFEDTADGRLTLDPAMLWLSDFDEAVNIGMGVKINLNASQQAGGFDKLVVLGLRTSSDQDTSKDLLEELIEQKRYMPGGFELIPQGTPTNNTADEQSGYISKDYAHIASYQTERAGDLFQGNSANAVEIKTDGEWMAELLGIEYDALTNVRHSDNMDIAQAMDMNHVLWPSTLGYFMEQMLAGLLSQKDIDDTRRFFTRYISGRGPLPAFRAGKQPYGIMLATAFSKLNFPASDSVPHRIKMVLDRLDVDLASLISDVTTAENSGSDWQAAFLNTLGLHATSVEWHQRFAMGPRFYWNLMLYMGYTRNQVVAWWNNLRMKGHQLLTSFPFLSQEPFIFRMSHWEGQFQLNGHLVDDKPLSEAETLSTNYLDWLLVNSLENIREENFGSSAPPSALLYLLVRHAFLLENWDASLRLVPNPAFERQEQEFLHLKKHFSHPCSIGRFDMLFSTLSPSVEVPMDQFLVSNDLNNFPAEAEFLIKTRAAVERLKGVSTAGLERLMTEHLDLCTYRSDAWMTGLVNYQLDGLRNPQTGSRRKGIYLGAFGWLLNVKPGPGRQEVAPQDIPQAFDDPNAANLTYEAGNAGFIHGPSLAHAKAAAVLREGYLSRGSQEMEVNLSSERVRKALQIMEGIRDGQQLAALLGYRFERGLHEDYPGLEMDTYLIEFRRIFPLNANQETITSETTTSETTLAGEATEARNVVNGLKLLEQTRTGPYPWGMTGLPGSGDVKNALIAEVDILEDLVDAVADVAMSEGVYQAVMGNFPRAGAVLSALGSGKMLPEPEILRTPRTGHVLTHRMGMIIDNDGANPWSGIGTTVRRDADPVLNKYVAGLVGDPDKIVCQGEYITDEGLPTETIHPFTVKLSDLNLQPLDFIRVMNNALDDNSSELSRRIAYFVRTTNSLADAITVKLKYTDRTGLSTDTKTFYEMAPLTTNLERLMGASRPLHAEDFTLGGESVGDKPNYDLADAWTRVHGVYNSLNGTRGLLAAAIPLVSSIVDPLTDPGAPAAFSNLRNALLEASLFGIGRGVPASALGETAEIQELLKVTGDSVLAELDKRKAAAEQSLPSLLSGSRDSADTAEMIRAGAKDILGKDCVLIPKFSFQNADEIGQAYQDSNDLLSDAPPMAAEEWMQGAAKVRERMAHYERTVLMAESLLYGQSGAPDLDLTPFQLPYKSNDRWLGLPFTNTEPEPETLSLVMQCAAGFQASTPGNHSGLLVDEWQERIPSSAETTGIAFNYNEPDSEPPQSLLLVTSPVLNNKWEFQDLFDALTETLGWVMKRAVEPDQLADTDWAQLLPGVVAPVSDNGVTISTDFRKNNIN